MNIFLTPLNAEDEEGEISKPNRFIVSFMHLTFDTNKYGFSKVEITLDAGATKGTLILTKGVQGPKGDRDIVVDEELPFGRGFPKVIREYAFEEFVTTPTGIRFDNCVRV